MPTPGAGIVLCPAGNLQGHLHVDGEAHLFVASKAAWDDITDNLPRHAGYPPGSADPELPAPERDVPAGHVQGSCLCGDVRHEVTDAPLRISLCHCTRCQRARSAAFATNAVYRDSPLQWLQGRNGIREYKVPAAGYFTVAFGTRCGSPLPRISVERGIVVVPAGSLDVDPGMKSQSHIFVGSRAPWHRITDSLPQHEG